MWRQIAQSERAQLQLQAWNSLFTDEIFTVHSAGKAAGK